MSLAKFFLYISKTYCFHPPQGSLMPISKFITPSMAFALSKKVQLHLIRFHEVFDEAADLLGRHNL